MTTGQLFLYGGIGLMGVALLLMLILNTVYAVQKKRLHKLIQEDYNK